MPSECAVSTCTNNGRNTKGQDVKYYRFPNNKTMQKVWKSKCRRGDPFKVPNARICSVHFTEDDYERDLEHELLGLKPRKKLKADAVPSNRLPGSSTATHAVTEANTADVCQQTPASPTESHAIISTNECSFNNGTEASAADVCQWRLATFSTESHAAISPHEPGLDNATEASTDPVEFISAKRHRKVQLVVKSREARYHEREILKRALNRLRTISPLKRAADSSTSTSESEEALTSEILLENDKLRKRITEQAKYFAHKLRVIDGKISKVQTRCTMLKNRLKCEASGGQKMNQGFPQAQVQNVTQGEKRTWWDEEDICNAITLRSLSKKSYTYQRRYLKFPLPSLATLRNWTESFRCPPGILHSVLKLLKPRMASMSALERLCVISFDEMDLDARICYDEDSDQILGPCNNVQVAMARGICSTWKQPIFYDFDTPMSTSLLTQIIVALEEIGMQVLACVSDCAARNETVWSELNASHVTPYFVNPHDDKRKVWVFSDVPHLLKLLRNHFIDDGLRLPCCDIMIRSGVVKRLLQADNYELKIRRKLNSAHLDVKGKDRMQVLYAAQLFSGNTAKALEKIRPPEPEAAKFFQLVNDCFDVLNSRIPFDENNRMRSGFGILLEDQLNVLNEFDKVCFLMRCGSKIALLPFQRGFLMTISALKGLYEDVKSLGGTYILTSHLNLDCLESFFSRVRGLGQFYDPLPTEVKNRIRLLLLGAIAANIPMSRGANIVEVEPCITAGLFENINTLVAVNEPDDKELYDELISLTNVNDYDVHGAEVVFDCPTEAFRYLAGYVAYRGQNYDPSLGCPTSKLSMELEGIHWIECLSHIGLLEPTEKCIEMTEAFELNFLLMHGAGLAKRNVMSGLSKILLEKFPEIHKEIIRVYVRTRTFIRIRFLNHQVI